MLPTSAPSPGVITNGHNLRQEVWAHHSRLEAIKNAGAAAITTFNEWAQFLYSAKVAATAVNLFPGGLANPGTYAGAGRAVAQAYRALGEVHLYNDVVGNTSNSKCTDLVDFFEFFRADAITKGTLPAPTQAAGAGTQVRNTSKDYAVSATVNLNGGSAVTLTSVTKTAGGGTFSIVAGQARYVAPNLAETATANVVHTNAEGQTCTAVFTITVT